MITYYIYTTKVNQCSSQVDKRIIVDQVAIGRGLHTPLVHPPPPQLNQTNFFWSLEVSWKRFHLLTEKI